MNFHILTLFPEMVMQGLMTSITGRAAEQNYIGIEAVNIRDFSQNKHKKVDDYPYGGGAGMLMQAQPVFDACQSVFGRIPENHRKRVIYVTPQGTPFNQDMAAELAENDDLVFLCGHYEGIDERVLEEVVTDYVSIGDYVLTGGELAAMVMVDAVARLVPGVLNNEMSAETESFHQDLLEYPQYSRPESWHEKSVPKVLLSGNQKEIDAWRLQASIRRTKDRRPDLYKRYEELQECKDILMKQKLLHIDMIEAINRGWAKLVAREGANILLMEPKSHVYYFTALDETADPMEVFRRLSEKQKEDIDLLVLHQEQPAEKLLDFLGMNLLFGCRQVVYTRREQLPISGLYRGDGQPTEQGLVIRPLTFAHLKIVCDHYEHMDDTVYIKNRIASGEMFGAFVDGQLAGFVGTHEEGSIGLLEVLPEYRGRKIGKALETYMINYSLRLGHIPYGQVIEGNDRSMKLQESLGLYTSKSTVYWMEKPEENN